MGVLDEFVWAGCRELILNPGDAIERALRELLERRATRAGDDERRPDLLRQIARKTTEREAIMALFRRGTVTLTEAEGQLHALAQETAVLRGDLDALEAELALGAFYEEEITSAAVLLSTFAEDLEEIERTGNLERKRQIVERFDSQITVRTTDYRARPKTAEIEVRYRIGERRTSALELPSSPEGTPTRGHSSWSGHPGGQAPGR
jgi:hypothetical protein